MTTYTVELTEKQIRLLAGLADAEGEAEEDNDGEPMDADYVGDCYHIAGQLLAALMGEQRDPIDRVVADTLERNGFDAERAAELAADLDIRFAAEACLRASLPSRVTS